MEDDKGVKTTRHYLVKEDLFAVKKWKDVIRVNKKKLEDPYFNSCDETAIDLEAKQDADKIPNDAGLSPERKKNEIVEAIGDLSDLNFTTGSNDFTSQHSVKVILTQARLCEGQAM